MDLVWARLSLCVIATAVMSGCSGSSSGEDGGKDSASAPVPSPSASSFPFPTLTPTGSPSPSGQALPVRVTKTYQGFVSGLDQVEKLLPPDPGLGASATEKVLYSLRQKTLLMTQFKGRTSAWCADGGVQLAAGKKTECTVKYDGVNVHWTVSVPSTYRESDFLVEYGVSAHGTTVLKSEAVYSRFWDGYHEPGWELRCDRMPAFKVVKVGEDTGYDCQFLNPHVSPAAWHNVSVRISERGVDFT
ncbi:hypothetical protein [Streptomyces sp. OE57]|uniref:hypothetical protein n=1 Tax=Streptomyces lacaronensis TaxID=3379885 RepID=UPI0039B777EA